MQKHILRNFVIIFIVCLMSLFLLNGKVLGTEEPGSNGEVVAGDTTSTSSNEIDENNNDTANSANDNSNQAQNQENNNVNQNSTVSNQLANEQDVYTTQSTNDTVSGNSNGVTSNPSSSTLSLKQINSYSAGKTLPEANLGLNNILNVILIAIGVIIILLAIAILIRLKQ